MIELTANEGHYCDRCRATIPPGEWKLLRGETLVFQHVGEMRGVVMWDPYNSDRRCMWTLRVPVRR